MFHSYSACNSRESGVQEHAKCSDPISTMGFIRGEKDNFKAKV